MLLDGKKLSCASCIKGHRSSGCTHSTRPLIEIKKKGRPVTQCEHCRELRKTKQVHVKCLCEAKPPEGSAAPSSGGKAVSPSAVLTLDSKDLTCGCKTAGQCNCCTPRTSVKISSQNSHTLAAQDPPMLRRRATISHHHPLPKLSPSEPTQSRSQASTSPAPHAHGHDHSRHHTHTHNFTPYPPPRRPSSTSLERGLTPLDTSGNTWDWLGNGSPPDNASNLLNNFTPTPRLPSLPLGMLLTCRCGPDCTCPNCAEHSGITLPATITDIGPISCPDCYNTLKDESPSYGDFTFNLATDEGSFLVPLTSGSDGGQQGDVGGNSFTDMSAFLRPPSPYHVLMPCGAYSNPMMISPNSSNPPSIGGSSTSRSSSRNSAHSIGEYRRILPRPPMSAVSPTSPSAASFAIGYRGRQAPANYDYADGGLNLPSMMGPTVQHQVSPALAYPSKSLDSTNYFTSDHHQFNSEHHHQHFGWDPSPWGSPTLAPFVPPAMDLDPDLPSLYASPYPDLGYDYGDSSGIRFQ